MDSERFDGFTRGLATATSRRGVVTGFGLGLAASVFGLTRTGGVQAKGPCKSPKVRCGSGKNRVCCDSGQTCCGSVCCDSGLCNADGSGCGSPPLESTCTGDFDYCSAKSCGSASCVCGYTASESPTKGCYQQEIMEQGNLNDKCYDCQAFGSDDCNTRFGVDNMDCVGAFSGCCAHSNGRVCARRCNF